MTLNEGDFSIKVSNIFDVVEKIFS